MKVQAHLILHLAGMFLVFPLYIGSLVILICLDQSGILHVVSVPTLVSHLSQN